MNGGTTTGVWVVQSVCIAGAIGLLLTPRWPLRRRSTLGMMLVACSTLVQPVADLVWSSRAFQTPAWLAVAAVIALAGSLWMGERAGEP